MGTGFVEFRQLQEVEIFSYLLYSLAKSHFNGRGFVEAWMVVLLVSKSLNRVEETPICVAVNSAEPFHCSRDMLCDFCVVWVIQNELLDLLISLCELILVLLL